MNIGIAVHNYDLGEGTGGYTAELVPRIADRHEVTVYAARFKTDPPGHVQTVRVPAVMQTAYTAILSFPAALAAVRKRHDAMHAQGWVTTEAEVVTAHYVLAEWRRRARAHAVRSAVGERVFGRLITRLEGRLYRAARAVIAPSRGVADEIARHYGRGEGVHVVHHGFRVPPAVPSRRDARQALGLPPDGTYALWIGDARKGAMMAIESIAAVPGTRLIVAAHTPRERYLDHARQRGCLARVHWIGYQADIWRVYAAADLLLYPTIYDPFGLVVAEAMAAGVAPVVTKTAGVAELIDHGRSGWLLDAPEAEHVTRALATLASDPELRRRLGAGAREAAERRTWDDVARETLAVYETLAR